MTYEEYKAMLLSNGWESYARFMGTGMESGCELRHPDCNYVLTVSSTNDGVVAEASAIIPGFMNPVSTGKFGSPWSNKAFHTQAQRLSKLKRVVGESLRD